MSDAYYHKGLTIELDPSIPRLVIEGREVPAEKFTGLFDLSERSAVKAEKLRQYGRQEIESSSSFCKREAARQDQLAILAKGVQEWNEWRANNPTARPILYNSDLTRTALHFDLNGADFANAVLIEADLRGQELQQVNFHEANLGKANLHGANLTRANFCRADLYETDLSGAILHDANLQGAQLAKTTFQRAQLIGCKVYGMSAWDLRLAEAVQRDLIIRYRPGTGGEPTADSGEDEIIVDDLEVAHVVYLFLNNQSIRNVIDAMTSTAVLILGRFTPERKEVLNVVRDELRRRGLLPMLFDFEKPQSRNLTETIATLAHLARFVVADLTDAKSVPQELQLIVPDLPSLPVQPIILDSQYEWATFESLLQYHSVLKPYRYTDAKHLLQSLASDVIGPAELKTTELAERRKRIEEALKI